MYKMLACDLDGTLLSRFTDLPESNIFYMNEILESGVKVVLCSGRSPSSLKHYETKFGTISEGCYGIGLNGAVVYKCDTREIINETLFEAGVAEEIVRNLRKYDADLLAYRGCDLYVEHMTPVISDYVTKSGVNAKLVSDLENPGIQLSKVLIKGDFDILSKACEHMKTVIGGKANMFFTGETMLEFTGIGATKGNALVFLADHLGIDIDEVIAVGDNENDVSMITTAGLGIAVQNAKEEIKKYADYVTERTCEEGILEEIVNKFIGR